MCLWCAGFETDDMGIVKAETDVLLFQWPFDAVEKMALQMGPSINGFWRNLLTFQVGSGKPILTCQAPMARGVHER